MNVSRFASRQTFLLLALASLAAGSAASGQETLTTRDGRVHPVQIFGADASGIKVQMGAAQLTEPFANVLAVSMPAPPAYQAAVVAYQSRDFATALSNAKNVVGQYRCLPTEWAQSAMSMLGDIYVATGHLADAEAAYRDFQKAYPAAGTALVSVGLARIDLAKKDYTAASAKIDPITKGALGKRNFSRGASAILGQAFYVSGQIKEASGDLPGALQDYLRTVTIFPADRLAAAGAEERADALRKEHDVAVP